MTAIQPPHSPTFDHFLAQLHATGREKGDGFDHTHFDGLRPDERPEVERLLHEALAAGDSTAVNGLLLFDGAAAVRVLDETLRRLPPGDGTATTIAGRLWAATHDPRYQRALADGLTNDAPATRRLALNYLVETPPAPALIPFLRERLDHEREGANRALLGELLLFWSGAIPALAESYRLHGSLLDTLEDGNPWSRRRAIGELDRLIAR